jgi:F420-0:gamma-glutamyl ligase
MMDRFDRRVVIEADCSVDVLVVIASLLHGQSTRETKTREDLVENLQC